jgi:DNA invertase Pin-like site-specific DNA recombinase
MPSYVIYARKSTESEDRQVLSIDSQVQELRRLAEQRGIVAAELLTEAHSAKAPGRPVFGQLMRRVSRGGVQGIICWKMDRLARNHLDTGVILQALADGKLQEVITSDRTYSKDGNDRFMGSFELGMATKFIDDLRANVKRGNRARFQRGWPNYRPPLGYLNDRLNKTVVKDPVRFDLLRRAWQLVLTGSLRPMQVLWILNEKWGFRTPKMTRGGDLPLSAAVFYHLLHNSFYTGVMRLKSGEVYVGAYPPMVKQEEFDRVQEILAQAARPRPKHHDFTYTGLMRCGRCGGAITAEEHIKPGRHYIYYHCSRYKGATFCRERVVSETVLESQIVQILAGIRMPAKVLEWVLKQTTRSYEQETELQGKTQRMLESSIAASRKEAENLLSLRLRDIVPDDVYLARKQEIEERTAKLESQHTAPVRSQESLDALTRDTFMFADRMVETFRNGTKVQRRMILETVSYNRELKGRIVRMQLKKPFQFLAEAAGCQNWHTCCDAIRTWIRDTKEYFALPDLDKEPENAEPSYPNSSEMAMKGGRPGPQTSSG